MKITPKPKSFLATCTRKYLQVGFLISIALVIVAFKIPFYKDTNHDKLLVPEYETMVLDYLPPINVEKEKTPPKAKVVKQKLTETPNFVEAEEELPIIEEKIEAPTIDFSDIKFEIEKIEEPEIEVRDFAEKMPKFVGGELAMFKYVAERVRFCESAKRLEIEGKVHVRFVIDTDGNVTDVEIAKGLYPCLDKQAMDAVKNMPKWIPGEQGLQKVAVRMVLPVNFVLN